MPSYLDLALLGIVLVSALLSMVRGFTREILAIASWAAAAAAAYFLYSKVTPFLDPYIQKDTVKTIAAVAIVFFATLIVVSILTVKLSDAILDSKVGALDRTLGFVFGAVRGFLLGLVAFLFFSWLVPADKQPVWVANAKTRPLLQVTGDNLLAMLPDDLVNSIFKHLKRDKSAPGDAPPDESDGKAAIPTPPPLPEKRTDTTPATPANAATLSQTDRQKLNNLLGKPPAPAPRKQ